MSYRMAGHSTSDDPTGYRTREEENAWKVKDPVVRFQKWLQNQGGITEAEAQQNYDVEKANVLAALKEAETIPVPHSDEIIEDVYDTRPRRLQQQLAELKEHI